MDRSNLRLVHDASANPNNRTPEQDWGLENARQLSLFQDDERVCLNLVPMNMIDRFGFKNLLDANRPMSIIDMRRYPDFFGFFRSTQVALDHFKAAHIEYNHVPLDSKSSMKVEEVWELRTSLLDELNRAKSQRGLFGQTSLLLVASREVEHQCAKLLCSLPSFDESWRINSL